MRCERCGRDFAAGLDKCPHCGTAAHYGGNTEFYGKVVSSKLTVGDLFAGVFQKHPKGAGAKMFMAGTPLSTPAPNRMLSEWQKPWLFARVLAVGLLFAAICYWLAGNGLGATVYSLFSLGSLIVPLSVLIFYWETNIPRDIPLYTVLFIMLIGGLLSFVFLALLPDISGGAEMAAFTEEPAKLLALAVFVYFLDAKYIFGGMLIGAAVGAGFAGMETIAYVMTNGSFDVLVLRSVLAIGGHVSWAAIEGGALVMVKGGEKLSPRHFADKRFLPYLAATMGMHFIWNSDIALMEIPVFVTLKHLLMCAAAVYVSFLLLKKAVAQVLAVADNAQLHPSASRPAGSQAVLSAYSGPLAGADFPFQQSITIGCDSSQCNVVLPAGTPGVSRRHCTLELRPDGVYLMDHNSSYGTYWQSGQRVPSNQWVAVTGSFCLGSQAVSFGCKESRPLSQAQI